MKHFDGSHAFLTQAQIGVYYTISLLPIEVPESLQGDPERHLFPKHFNVHADFAFCCLGLSFR